MKSIKTLTVMAAAVCCLTVTSQATIVLAPGTSGPIGASSALDGAPIVIQGPTALGFASTAWTGVLTSTVLLESSAFNSLGGFTFVYHLANDATSTESLGRLTVIDWQGGSALIVGGNTGAGNAADSADRSLGAGGTIGFTWAASTPILAGTFGEVFVRTDSSVWNPSTAFVIDGGVASVGTYAVPEPTTMIAGAMLLLPFGASTLRLLRKSRTA